MESVTTSASSSINETHLLPAAHLLLHTHCLMNIAHLQSLLDRCRPAYELVSQPKTSSPGSRNTAMNSLRGGSHSRALRRHSRPKLTTAGPTFLHQGGRGLSKPLSSYPITCAFKHVTMLFCLMGGSSGIQHNRA